jgi:hypothetical protein
MKLGFQRIMALFAASNDPVGGEDRNAYIPAAVDLNGILWTRDIAAGGPLPPAGEPGSPIIAFDTPAAATAPDADTPTAGAGFRNILQNLTVTLNAVAAQGVLTVVVRDGATGAGTILYSFFIGPLAAGTSQIINIPGLNIYGSDDTEMTVETTAAPAATNFASIAWTGIIGTV